MNQFNNYDQLAQSLVTKLGKVIVIGVPLGLGKPIGIINSLYRLAEKDKSIQLTIVTGLTLARPLLRNAIEERFAKPILERLLGDFEDPLYETPRLKQNLPENIRVIEFFLAPGKYLFNDYVQQNYINSNYTTVTRDVLHFKINVIAQMVSKRDDKYSLSSNTDLFADVVKQLKQVEYPSAIVAEVNQQLPYMKGNAEVTEDIFTDIVDTKQYRHLFALPSDELTLQEHLIGLYSSRLIPDGACLQIGIGKLSIATSAALILRQKDNSIYQQVISKLKVKEKFAEVLKAGDSQPFQEGLYASTEMFSDAYIHLFKENILKKKVYDDIDLQTLVNNKKNNIIDDNLLENLKDKHIEFFQTFIDEDFNLSIDLSNQEARAHYLKNLADKTLKNGRVLHGGFFLGTQSFYDQLCHLSPTELNLIDMTTISRTNLLAWNPKLLRLQRQNARFINSAMMVTLGSVVISDGLVDLQEVSGVGGQFDFIDMAHKLEGARSIINVLSTRRVKRTVRSNIVWNYPNLTVPRYLRDIVITEYGIADCRSKTDEEVIKAMLNITDSRFQNKLMALAKKAGKLNKTYQIPQLYRQNFPQRLQQDLAEFQHAGVFQAFPFGTELTKEELVLKTALEYLQDHNKLILLIAGIFANKNHYSIYLERMKLTTPRTLKEWLYQKLILGALISKR